MNWCLLLALGIVIFILLCHYHNKSNLRANGVVRANVHDIQSQLKSGDIVLVSGPKKYVRKMYILYRNGNTINVVLKHPNGKLYLEPLDEFIEPIDASIHVLMLRQDLTDIQLDAYQELLGRNYARAGNSNVVLTFQNQRYFYEAPTYMLAIFAKVGVIKAGYDPTCLNNTSPSCLQQLYEDSIFIDGDIFDSKAYEIKVLPVE